MNAQRQNPKQDDIEPRVNLLEYQFDEVIKRLDRIETKQDVAASIFASQRNVDVQTFQEFIKDADKKYATNESIKPMKTLFWGIVTALILGLISLAFWAIQQGLQA